MSLIKIADKLINPTGFVNHSLHVANLMTQAFGVVD